MYGVQALRWPGPAVAIPIPNTPPTISQGRGDGADRSRTSGRGGKSKKNPLDESDDSGARRRRVSSDDHSRHSKFTERLSIEARNVDLARRRAEHSLSEKQAELDEARRREQSLIQEGREIVRERNKRLKDTEDKLNQEREPPKLSQQRLNVQKHWLNRLLLNNKSIT